MQTSKRQKHGEATASGEAASSGAQPRLDQVLAVLGDSVTVLADATGVHRRVTRPVVYDPADSTLIAPGDVVLAVGLVEDQRGTLRLIRQAGTRGAAAVAVRQRIVATELLDAAAETGIALLSAAAGVSWGELHSLLVAAIAAADTSAIAPGDATAVSDLFTLSDIIAAQLGGPVIIEDTEFRVLAYSSLQQPDDEPRRQAILSRHVPQEWLERLTQTGLRRRLLSTDAIVSIDPDFLPGARRRRVTAIRAGGEFLGILWLGEGAESFPPGIDSAVRQAAQVIASHLVRISAHQDRGRGRTAALFRALLDGTDTAEQLAESLGVPADSPCAVTAFRPVDSEAATPARLARAVDILSVHFQALRRPSAVVDKELTVCTLFAAADLAEDDEFRQLVTDAVRRLEAALGIRMCAGYGSVRASLGQAPESHREAAKVLAALATRQDGSNVAGFEELREAITLAEVEHFLDAHPSLLRGRIAALVSHDAEHGTSYAETLQAYLDCFGDYAAAAARLHLHVNSFRYRIRRLCDIAGLDLTDPVQRLVAQLQLRALAGRDSS